MFSPRHRLFAGRRAARRVIDLPCELITSDDEESWLAWGTDLSESGLFIERAVVPAGAIVVVCFSPTVSWRARGRNPQNRAELTLFAEVARTARGRRRDDADVGAGLRFIDLGSGERRALWDWLSPRPLAEPASLPPAPRVRRVGAIERGAVSAGPYGEHPFASRLS